MRTICENEQVAQCAEKAKVRTSCDNGKDSDKTKPTDVGRPRRYSVLVYPA